MSRTIILTFLLFTLVLVNTTYSQVKKSVLLLIAPTNFRDEELFETKKVLEKCGLNVDVASLVKGPAKGMLGGTYNVELTVGEVNIYNYNAILVIGGSGAEIFFNNQDVISLIKESYASGRVVGAICIAPKVLLKAGIMSGRKGTIWSSMAHEFKKFGAIYTGRNVEVDGRIVTANGPWAARAFGEAVCKLLGYR